MSVMSEINSELVEIVLAKDYDKLMELYYQQDILKLQQQGGQVTEVTDTAKYVREVGDSIEEDEADNMDDFEYVLMLKIQDLVGIKPKKVYPSAVTTWE